MTHLSPCERTPRPESSGGCHADVAQGCLGQLVERLQPEAFYAFGDDGQRTILAVFDLADPSQIPALTEPLYQQGKAKVTMTPCMTLEDLQKGVEEAARQMAEMQA